MLLNDFQIVWLFGMLALSMMVNVFLLIIYFKKDKG